MKAYLFYLLYNVLGLACLLGLGAAVFVCDGNLTLGIGMGLTCIVGFLTLRYYV